MISPDDPRLTAYASGDLSPEESSAFEAELAADPAARAEVVRLRVLQSGLAEAFGAEARAGAAIANVRAESRADASLRRRWWVREMPAWVGSLASAACVVLILSSVMIPTVGSVRETARKTVDASNLRQIGHAALIYANDHKDRFPVADDVWSFAGILAKAEGLNDPFFWVSGQDPANSFSQSELTTVLTKNGQGLQPQFRATKLSVAVALGDIVLGRDPATTPIAWTRGLRTDGTWAPHAPYGSWGGHIVFIGGNIQTFRDLNADGGQLVRYDGKGKTGNILEVLPPGVRIGEYVPTEHEQRDWAEAARAPKTQFKQETIAERWPVLVFIWAGGLILCIVQAVRGVWRWRVVLWFLGVAALVLLLESTRQVREL